MFGTVYGIQFNYRVKFFDRETRELLEVVDTQTFHAAYDIAIHLTSDYRHDSRDVTAHIYCDNPEVISKYVILQTAAGISVMRTTDFRQINVRRCAR